VMRGLAIGGVLLTVLAFASHSIPRKLGVHSNLFWQPAAALLATAAWMVWSSRVGKRRTVRALLDRHAWRGDEAVLDVGCGRGLATIAAARHAHAGHVIGIDLWRSRDLAGNSPQAARANAQAEGLATQISFATGDATGLPFADASFDVVVSMTALHNIPTASGRSRAIEEALRVLRPGGSLLIFDILHTRKYAAFARSAGAQDIWLSRPAVLWALPGWSMAAKSPAST